MFFIISKYFNNITKLIQRIKSDFKLLLLIIIVIDIMSYSYYFQIFETRYSILNPDINIKNVENIRFNRTNILVYNKYRPGYVDIELGRKDEKYWASSSRKTNKVYAYNEEQKSITFKINNLFLNDTSTKTRYKITDGLLTVFLTERENKIVYKGLKVMQKDGKIINLIDDNIFRNFYLKMFQHYEIYYEIYMKVLQNRIKK